MFSKKSAIVLSLIAITACSNKHNFIQERQRTNPPQNAQDVGTILEGADHKQVNAILEAHPEAQVRVLNTEHGMYEIFGVAIDQVRQEFEGTSSRNEFFELRPQQRVDLYSMGAPAGLTLKGLPPCTLGEDVPTAQLTAEFPAADVQTVELGQTIKVNGGKSSASDGDTEPLKMGFHVEFPETAAVRVTEQVGETLELKTETLGLHKVFLLVQNSKGVCAMDSLSYIVTANRPYNGPNAPDLQTDLSKFKHLAMVHAQEAWELSKGTDVTIAIIDTGVNYNHPSLAPNIKLNPGETPANQIDDEGNGFIDDYVGFDFVNNDGSPYDDDSHGTHVAGLAAAKQFGMAPNAKILPLKALTSLGGDIGTISAAIRYAVDRKVNIINLSLGSGGPRPHPALISATAYAEQNGVLVIVAAGNGDPQTGLGFDIERTPVWPARMINENLVAVAAFDSINDLSPYSNFGKVSVDVVAPGGVQGDPMISCAFENPQGELLIGMNGTSMATPVVAGIAADLWSQNPGMNFKEIKELLIAAGTTVPQLQPITVSGKHIDALSALQLSATKNVLF